VKKAPSLRKPRRSLRTILIVWFFLFSVVPLAFITGYSVIKYEKAIDNELSQRLLGNAREVSVILSDFQAGLRERRDKYLKSNSLIYHLSTSDSQSLRSQAQTWLRSEIATSLTFFNRDGKMLVSVFKDDRNEVREFVGANNSALYLSDQNIQRMKDVDQFAFVEFGNSQKISLILFSKVVNNSGRHVGYIEQLIDLERNFLDRLKRRMKLELILLRSNGQPLVATHNDFYVYKKDFFANYVLPDSNPFFELSIRNNPYGFIMYPLSWGQTNFFLALGASKLEATTVLKNVNFAFFSVVGAVILLLTVMIIFVSKTIIRPISELVEAIADMQNSDRVVEIPIKSETEIGLLTESFNQMSRNVSQARADLKRKINELESANLELKETQSRLVHSSKMVSLGQLVAGVAHELNNPIGFIYSNMSHLREYSNKLLNLIDTAQKNPSRLNEAVAASDLDYIREDLPKLIASCEDGARRTRDIVLGLRNFSRLEEAKLKDIDVHEAIDNTLNLLSGEIKNRIQIHKDYAPVPPLLCYASQINQIFMNILTNAAQAIEGSGNIWISTKLTQLNDKDAVAISFQDSGKGMTPEVLEKIFDPFFSTKGVGQGTGLGLSISYGIIQSHGGEIQVKSQPGIGTEFVIKLPLKPPTAS
jgi:two-component system NtrC family sensor kinase